MDARDIESIRPEGVRLRLPGDLENAYRHRIMPVRVYDLNLAALTCLVFSLAGIFLGPEMQAGAWLGLGILTTTVIWSRVKPPKKSSGLLVFFLVIISSTAWIVLTLPVTAWEENLVLYLLLGIETAIFTGFKLSPLRATVLALLLVSVYLSLLIIWSVDPALSIAAQTTILFISTGFGTTAVYGIAHENRSRFVYNRIRRELEQKIKTFEHQQHEELIDMNKSLALEISAHAEAEARLKESEENYKNLVNSLPQGIFIVQKGQIVFSNPGLEQLTGFSVDQLNGMIPDELFAGKGYEFIRSASNRRISTETQWVDVRYNTEPARLFVIKDVSEQIHAQKEKKQLESELQKAKKMEALGLMAAGVAHDLNNVLSGLVSTPELAMMELPENSKMRETLLTIKDSGKRASVIVDELLTLGRGSAKSIEPVCVNDIVTDYLESPEFKKSTDFYPDILVETNLEKNLPIIGASGIHIRKVVMNLVNNALEAIKNKGRVILTTEKVKFKDTRLKGYKKILEGDYLCLRVSDTGPGIDAGDLDRIFEPFYTKKIMGRSGTGLGLSIVWNVVHDHEGYIQVKSDKNGTCFELYFPVSTALQNTDKIDKIYTLSDYTGNNETVLVVDDADNQQKITSNMLLRMGYKAFAVASGEDAIDFVTHNPQVDLVVLDMIMAPGMDGLETFKALRDINPNIKAVLASGYSKTELVEEAQRYGAGPFIKKPFSLQTLGLAIKKELKRVEK
ncbi:MAG: ATP-binding protein [Desulfobacterales bacterium]|nr:ATP-binding protein [Desulfobacterales bacterium]